MALWTDLAEWRGPTVNVGDGDTNVSEPADRMYEYRGLVVHIAVGYYEGTIAWQKNPDANVSSHFVVARDGRIAQVVDTAIRAWTQSAGNGYWLSVENEGFLLGDRRNPGDWHLLSPAMVEANARLLARAHREYGVPLQLATSPTGRGLGYHSMGAENGYNWGHSACPGEPIKAQLASVLARAVEIVKGHDMPLEGIDKAQVSNSEHYLQSLVGMTDQAELISDVTQHDLKVSNKLTAAVRDIQATLAKLSAPAPVPIDQDALNAAVAAAISNPAVLDAIAKAVVAENARELTD